MALPVMRLSGIYLALATAAFAVAMDRWIFNLPDFDVGPIHVSLFGLGSTNIDPLSVLGYRFDTPARLLMLSAVAFALMTILVAALRWSRFGRQLVAMRDSEAACATFGLDLRWPRVGVFALSAGIAGLGGALYGMQLGTVAPSRYDVLTGLPIFILVVVGGAGLVGGALFAGISLFGLIPLTSGLGPLFAKINTVTPGLTGIGLGRNPSGALPLMSAAVAALRRDRLVLAAMVAVMTGAYVLRMAGLYANWPFVGLLIVAFVVANVSAGRRVGTEAVDAERAPDAAAAVPRRELEWAGISEPWTTEDLSSMNEALAFDGGGGVPFRPARPSPRSGAVGAPAPSMVGEVSRGGA